MNTALLFHLDGKLPNLALMRLSAYLQAQGKEVLFRRTGQPERTLWETCAPDEVYGSVVFESSRFIGERLLKAYPNAVIGGTGWSVESNMQRELGVPEGGQLDYSLYPAFQHSIGFTQRGCRLRCKFCCVPRKEGAVRDGVSAVDIWRGAPYPRNLLLLDNDFFGGHDWRENIAAIRDGGFKVCFSQGINARMLTDETAEAIASIPYYDDQFKTRRIYTAWDNKKDEQRLFAGLNRLVKYGVKADHIMVYVLIGYWSGETTEDRLYRIESLLDFGARPYPMPYVRTPELVGMQRWAIGAYAKRIPWKRWAGAHYRPENLGNHNEAQTALFPILEATA